MQQRGGGESNGKKKSFEGPATSTLYQVPLARTAIPNFFFFLGPNVWGLRSDSQGGNEGERLSPSRPEPGTRCRDANQMKKPSIVTALCFSGVGEPLIGRLARCWALLCSFSQWPRSTNRACNFGRGIAPPQPGAPPTLDCRLPSHRMRDVHIGQPLDDGLSFAFSFFFCLIFLESSNRSRDACNREMLLAAPHGVSYESFAAAAPLRGSGNLVYSH